MKNETYNSKMKMKILKMKIKNENSYSKMKKYCGNLAIFE